MAETTAFTPETVEAWRRLAEQMSAFFQQLVKALKPAIEAMLRGFRALRHLFAQWRWANLRRPAPHLAHPTPLSLSRGILYARRRR